jgi:plasmid stability protein
LPGPDEFTIIDEQSVTDRKKKPRMGMASIAIWNLDDGLKARLRVRAAKHGRSMEDEARDTLRKELESERQPRRNLASAIRRRFSPLSGNDLPATPRAAMREPPDFSR